MSADTKDWLQAAVWAVAIIGGLIAAAKAIAELRRANEQRRQDLRWKQAEMAKKCIDELLATPHARAALRMLDWFNWEYDLPKGGTTGPISHEQRLAALRTENPVFPQSDVASPFVRDAYDSLFDGFERLEHFIQIDLIRFEDIQPPLRYYVAKMATAEERPAFEYFLGRYEFERAAALLKRFPEWGAA